MTHICVGRLTIIGSDNSLSPSRRQSIIWTNVGILYNGPLETDFIYFHSRKIIWYCRREIGGHFVSASMCYALSLLLHPKGARLVGSIQSCFWWNHYKLCFGFRMKVFRDFSYGVKLQCSFETDGTNVVTEGEAVVYNDSRNFNWLFKSKDGTLIRFQFNFVSRNRNSFLSNICQD